MFTQILEIKKTTIDKVRLRTILALIFALSISSCSKTIRFNNSVVVPGADGKVTLSKDDNKNNRIEMTVTNLADPSRLSPAKKTYVVWMQTKNDGVKNIGQLVSETGYFSSARKATLNSVTPFQPLSFFVTAEDDASIQNPGTQTVLTTREF
jgi:hypothetical protein